MNASRHDDDKQPTWKKAAIFTLGLALAAAALAPTLAQADNEAEAEMAAENPGSTPADLEKLFQDGRYQAAADLAARLREAASARGDEPAATLALIREVQARIGLGASETALRLLLDSPAPAARREQLIYLLFRGETLSRYFDAYGWEIRQREEIGPIDRTPVDKWTAEQLNLEILRAFAGAWEQRDAWGAESVAPLSGLLEQNDYPARIRGTLRDTLSYLFAEALGNSSRFTPRESNEIYRLDLGVLLAPAVAAPPGAALAPDRHPLERLALVLADLEAWHRDNGRPEAALEAYLTRLDSLRAHFSAAADRERFESELSRTLAAFPPALEWRAMGLVRLGEWRRDGDAPDALQRAHQTFKEAEAAFPGSIGGRRARALIDQLEMPQLGFESIFIDGPRRPSLTVTHANIKRLHLRAYELPAEKQRSVATMFRSEARALAELLRTSRPVAEWQAELVDPGDFRTHRTYLTPPLEKLGHYVIFASERPDFALENNRAQALQMVISEMVVLGRPLVQTVETEVEVRAGSDGKALPGTDIELLSSYGRNPYSEVAAKKTDAEGKAGFDLSPVAAGSQLFLAASRGADHIFTGDWLQRPYLAPEGSPTETSHLLFTDRGVYRPGQQILFKAIAYQYDKRNQERRVLPDAELTVELFDANGQQVATQALRTNRHGSASGALAIPAGRMLGDWSLRTGGGAWRNVKVEEYKRPTFELAILDPAVPLRLNQEARLAGNARYYFGTPLRAGKVSWRVTRTPSYPRWWYFFPPAGGNQNVASGEGQLDAEGRFEMVFLPEADARLAATQEGREIAYNYRISAELTDEGGETRSAERTFRAGFVMVDASLEPSRPFFGEKEKIEVELRRTDLDGKGRAGRGSWRLMKVDASRPLLPAELPVPLPPGAEKFALPGDRTRPRHQAVYDEAAARRLLADGAEAARGELVADDNGKATLSLPAGQPAGLYRLRYRTADEAGAEIERTVEILVARQQMAGVGLAVLLEADRARVQPGEELRLVAGSGLPQVPAVVEIFRGERRVFRRELPAGRMDLFSYKVTPEDAAGLIVEIKAVADYQLLNLRREIEVPADRERLAVSFASFRDRLRPGQPETFTIEVKSADGSSLDPRLVEILSYMYDRSLDVFAPPPAGSPFARYTYGSRAMPVYSSLRQSYPFFRSDRPGPASEYPSLRGDRLTLYDRVDIGGMRGGFAGGLKTMAMVPEAMPMARSAEGAMDAAAPPPPPPAPAPQSLAMMNGLGDGAGAPAPPTPQLRENFAETAFFEPHLEPGDDGRVSFEFEVPDSVTEWNVFTHALAADFRFGSDKRTTRSVKELQVRPYLPRFLRESDRAELRVSVDNTGDAGVLEGSLDLELVDEENGESLLGAFGLEKDKAAGRPFRVEPGKSAILTFPFAVPSRLGPVVLRVKAATRGGELSDGEQRLLPILPSRVHLAQSRFAVLDDRARRTLVFENLRRDDDTSRIDEKMVVTLDGQLFTTVLRALPYLVDYPYRCTEQNLNRFVSTGVMTALFERHPAIAKLAKKLAERGTPLEPFPAADPNRAILLEETPWLDESRGGEAAAGAKLERILDPAVARAVRDGAIGELQQAQDASGGFPWWPGGQPSVFFTVYLLQGFARATELGVEIPREMIERAWLFVYRELQPEIEKLKDPKEMRESWYTVTWLNYVLSTYPDLSYTGGAFSEEDRRRMLETSLLHWREMPRRVRLYLALTAHRLGRTAEAKQVLESVMDGARTTPDQGTFWQPEDRAWLFWWDRIETHALALRTLMEVAPQDERRHGLVLWLMLNKKLNQWSSTRSTAEVIYSLVAYLEAEGEIGVREEVAVDFAGKREKIVFEPDSAETRRQLTLEGEKIEPARDAEIEISKETPGLLFASATWHFSTEKLPAAASSDFFGVGRRYFRRAFQGGQYRLEPLAEGAQVAVGDEVEVELEIEAKHAAEYVHLRDPRGAGFEPVDLVSGWRWDLGLGHYREIRDSATNFFFETLPPGKMTLRYRLRAATAGSFRIGPATLQSMYAPEFAAYSAGEKLEIAP